MNLDKLDKIGNILLGIGGVCMAATMFFINVRAVLALLIIAAIGCMCLREWLFNKFSKMDDSQEKES